MPKKNNSQDLSDLIISKYPELSKQEKKIADFLIQNKTFPFILTGKKLSLKTGVSEATIVRFAKHLGFRGFQHLKSRIAEDLSEQFMPEDRFKFMRRSKNPISTISRVAEKEMENINQTINHLDLKQLQEFIQSLHRADYVYTIGLGISALLARLAAYLFNQAGIRAYACQKEEHSFIERLINLDSKDAVLAFSFPPYSKETIDSLKFCFQKDIPCLALTDKPTAPIVKWTHSHLVVQSRNLFFTNAVSSITMMLNAISTELALFNKNKSADNSKLVFEAVKDEYLL